MDVGLHEIAHGGIDAAMPGQRGQAGEGLADDRDGEMPAAIPRTGMTDMLVAFVHDLERQRRQLLQRGANHFGAGGPVHGRACRKGFTSTRPRR